MEIIPSHKLAQTLIAKGSPQLAYQMLRKQYEASTWQSAAPDQQVEVLIQLADLSLQLGNKPKCSLPYIDEALLLGSQQSETLEELRAYYIGLCHPLTTRG